MNDLVSVITPTYNRSHFVTEAIDSVLCQTYPNIELIVVNDGSTDDTEEKLQPYIDRITYLKKENGGISSAVNAGLRAAKGKYIARLDDDDLFMPDRIEKQVKVFGENPDVGMVVSGSFITDAIGRTLAVVKAPDFSEYGPFLTLLLQYTLLQPAVMVRRECHDKLGFYKDTFAEDYEMSLRISRYWNVAVVDQPVAKCRRHSTNVTIGMRENDEFQQDIRSFIRDTLDDVSLTELFPAIGSSSDTYRESCAYAAKGAIYLRHKIFDRADAGFLKALELCPTNSMPLLWLGISARSQGDFQSAEEYFDEIQENDELYRVARNAKDLITAIQKNEDEDSLLLKSEVSKERMRLFKISFDSISGKAAERKSPRGSADRALKLSQYAVIIDNYPQRGKHLVFNTFTHAMVSIGDDLREIIRNPNGPVGEDALKNVRVLRKMGMLVREGLDEAEIARKWYNTFRKDMSKIYATVLTTYNCNFACKYCIEQGVKKPIYMDDQCSDALVEWLTTQASKNGTKHISLSFYGGEPLLNVRPMYRISEKLQEFAVNNGVLLSSSIITNGSLLSAELLGDLAKYGLKSIKVTIDGEREIHDAKRPFKSGRGSFDIIIENIQKIPETINLTIQTNLDSENMASFPRLLDFFERSGLKDRIDNLTVSPIFQSLGSGLMPIAQGTDCTKLSDPRMDDDLDYMKRLLMERGYRSKSYTIDYMICRMNRSGSMVVIDPLGDIYSCPAFVGREGFSIGDVYHAELNGSESLSDAQLEGCFQCSYFPICGGGCRYMAYVLYGDHNRISCDREAVEHQTKELIKLRYDQKTNQRKIT